MKELEQMIIGSCFGEDQYRQISFLEANDFTNYPEKPFREFWKLLEINKAYDLTLMKVLSKCQDQHLKNLLMLNCDVVAAANLHRYALCLLETRFKALLITLLVNLSNDSKNALEVELLSHCQVAVIKEDLFDLSDNLIEYLGSQASEGTKRRINDFLKYRDRRVNEAKKVINELN